MWILLSDLKKKKKEARQVRGGIEGTRHLLEIIRYEPAGSCSRALWVLEMMEGDKDESKRLVFTSGRSRQGHARVMEKA